MTASWPHNLNRSWVSSCPKGGSTGRGGGQKGLPKSLTHASVVGGAAAVAGALCGQTTLKLLKSDSRTDRQSDSALAICHTCLAHFARIVFNFN